MEKGKHKRLRNKKGKSVRLQKLASETGWLFHYPIVQSIIDHASCDVQADIEAPSFSRQLLKVIGKTRNVARVLGV